MSVQFIDNFSAQTTESKRQIIATQTGETDKILTTLEQSFPDDPMIRQRFESFSENNLGLYSLPMGWLPIFLINGKIYHIPMVTEESSVVAAASSSGKYWYSRGGFTSVVNGREKNGQVHFAVESPAGLVRCCNQGAWPSVYRRASPSR